jgi:hypothetical protein
MSGTPARRPGPLRSTEKVFPILGEALGCKKMQSPATTHQMELAGGRTGDLLRAIRAVEGNKAYEPGSVCSD